MKFFSENLLDLRALYINQLRKISSMERQIVESLPTMIEQATDPELKLALESHLGETEIHVDRVTSLLNRTGAREIDPIKCKVMAALSAEAEDMILDAKDESVRDAAIIAAAQRVEHYEIAVYGAVRTFAQILGQTIDAEILDETIQEEGHADQLLTRISDHVNPLARKAA